MTSRLLVPFLLLAAACSGDKDSNVSATANASTPPASMAAPSPAGPSIAAEIVTIDASAPSLTLREGDVPPLKAPGAKDLKPTDRTIRVEATAASDLSALKPGQKVQVTCSSAPTVVTGPAGAPATGVSAVSAASALPPAAGSGPPADLARCDSIVRIAALEPPAP